MRIYSEVYDIDSFGHNDIIILPGRIVNMPFKMYSF